MIFFSEEFDIIPDQAHNIISKLVVLISKIPKILARNCIFLSIMMFLLNRYAFRSYHVLQLN
jgi:hypothetical protein